MSQRLDGIEPAAREGRVSAGHKARAYGHPEGNEDNSGGYFRRDLRLPQSYLAHRVSTAYGQAQADQASRQAEGRSLYEELEQYIAALGADCLADAYLPRPSR